MRARIVFMFIDAHACARVCIPSPLDSLLVLVFMVSVPTTAPMFAVVVVETGASVMLKSVSLSCHVFGRLQRTLTLPSHPASLPVSMAALGRETPLSLSSLLSRFLTPSHGAPPLFLSRSRFPFFPPHTLPDSLSPSLQLPCFSSGVVAPLPPSHSHTLSLCLCLPPTYKPQAKSQAEHQ